MAISRLTHPRSNQGSQAALAVQPPAAPLPLGGSADLLTPAEAAALLKVSKKALERWRGAGGGPPFLRFNAKTIRYRRRDVLAFIEGSVRTNTAG